MSNSTQQDTKKEGAGSTAKQQGGALAKVEAPAAIPPKPGAAVVGKKRSEMTLTERLADPFHPTWLRALPRVVRDTSALAVAYVTARDVMQRLDDVMGVTGWADDYEMLPDGCVRCRLTLHFPERSVTKVDVGGPSEQEDDGDKMKAAHSDALKRTAVKFGIGRYLYFLPPMWLKYDKTKKQFLEAPKLPAWAVPAASDPVEAPTPQMAEATTEIIPTPDEKPKAKNGEELKRMVTEFEQKNAKVFKPGSLLGWIVNVAGRAGWKEPIEKWGEDAIAFVSLLNPAVGEAVNGRAVLGPVQAVADHHAQALQAKIEEQGSENLGRLFGDWLKRQGCPSREQLARYPFRGLLKIAQALEAQIAEDKAKDAEYERQEREGIQGADGKSTTVSVTVKGS